jgi:hypothetical protein
MNIFNNYKNTVIAGIAATQDGTTLAQRKDQYSDFIMECIEQNSTADNIVNIEELESNFSYMIDQLTRARKPLQEFIKRYAVMLLIVVSSAIFGTSASAQTKEPAHCTATTKAGNPCKGKAVNNTAFCATHNPNADRCGFIKKDGTPCKMQVKEKGLKCHHHNNTANTTK